MLHEIQSDGTIMWYCQAREFQDDPPCGILNTVSLDELVYQEWPLASPGTGQGAMIRLPICRCGFRTDIKADYSMKELYKALIQYEEQGMCAYLLPLRYVHNLHIHFLLYQHGKATFPPVLDMPPQEVLELPSFAGVKPSTVYALWFGFTVMKQYAPHELEANKVLLIGA